MGYIIIFFSYSILGSLTYLLFYNFSNLETNENTFLLFIEEGSFNILPLLGTLAIMTGNLISSIFDLIPFMRIFDKFISR